MQKPTYAFSGSKGLTDKTNPIVFIHGTGMDHTVWTLPARHFVRHKRNVLAIDLPAHGRSSGPAADSAAETYPDYAGFQLVCSLYLPGLGLRAGPRQYRKE